MDGQTDATKHIISPASRLIIMATRGGGVWNQLATKSGLDGNP